jgi:F0F1-type ATP synthase membrane subunit b/b'
MALDPLAQLNLVTILAIILITGATLLLLRRTFFLPVIGVMESRAAKIEAARARKAAALAALQAAEADAERMLAAAGVETARLVAGVQEQIAGLRTERLARAGAEAEALLARGREEMVALVQAEENRLQTELCDCVSRTLATMIGQVDDSAVRLMVHRVLAAKEGR